MSKTPEKIKLVVSDFHLGLGTQPAGPHTRVLEDFFYADHFIEFLNYYSSGRYSHLDVELIINGDFFNLLMIDFDEIDPDVITELVALRRMKKIMDGHDSTMQALKSFIEKPQKKITMIMGNHDPGILFSSVQDLIRQRISKDIEFFLEAYIFDGIHIEHGNQYEVANAFKKEQYFITENLPQPILNQPWGTYFLVHVLNKIKARKKHIDKVLPFGRLLRWLLLTDIRFFGRVLIMIFKFFLDGRLSKDPRRGIRLKDTLKVLIDAPVFPDLDRAARRLLTNNNLRCVIFGHNHRPSFQKYDDASIYMNTGTWNEMTNLELDSFGTRLVCSFALIEYHNSIPQFSLKVWKGKHKVLNLLESA